MECDDVPVEAHLTKPTDNDHGATYHPTEEEQG
jgi:hypothetical protein